MPLVSVGYLHEIVYGSTRIVEHSMYGNSEPLRFTHSLRMAREREQIYRDWFTVRMNSKGWYDLGERVEILWGPDYRDRYDVYVFRDNRIERRFAKLPGDFGLPVVDQRREIKVFDAEKGLRSNCPNSAGACSARRFTSHDRAARGCTATLSKLRKIRTTCELPSTRNDCRSDSRGMV